MKEVACNYPNSRHVQLPDASRIHGFRCTMPMKLTDCIAITANQSLPRRQDGAMFGHRSKLGRPKPYARAVTQSLFNDLEGGE